MWFFPIPALTVAMIWAYRTGSDIYYGMADSSYRGRTPGDLPDALPTAGVPAQAPGKI